VTHLLTEDLHLGRIVEGWLRIERERGKPEVIRDQNGDVAGLGFSNLHLYVALQTRPLEHLRNTADETPPLVLYRQIRPHIRNPHTARRR
jgi:hypothetical protein